MKKSNNKYLKVFLMICVLIASLSVMYYFVIFLPHKSELDRQRLIQNDIEEKEMNCIEDAKKLKLKCCAIGGFDDNKIIELLELDKENEIPIYAFALGK
jgi:hypothetical protein